MSSSIWTRCAASSEVGRLRTQAWRTAAAPHLVATRSLVDSLEEHDILEALLEAHKPRPLSGRLHYLLATPFRQPPLPHGSRFGKRHERGIWYGSEAVRTTFAEVAYHRLLFLHGTQADLGTIDLQLSLFRVAVATERGLDLCAAAFAAARDAIASKTAYEASQRLGREMREARVEACRYPSARDAGGGVCVAVLEPKTFGARRPTAWQTWYSFATRQRVEFRRQSHCGTDSYVFLLEAFSVGGRLPAPAA